MLNDAVLTAFGNKASDKGDATCYFRYNLCLPLSPEPQVVLVVYYCQFNNSFALFIAQKLRVWPDLGHLATIINVTSIVLPSDSA